MIPLHSPRSASLSAAQKQMEHTPLTPGHLSAATLSSLTNVSYHELQKRIPTKPKGLIKIHADN